MKITTISIDLAKTVFQIHGADARGKAVLRRQLKRAQMLPYFARLKPGKVTLPCFHVQQEDGSFLLSMVWTPLSED